MHTRQRAEGAQHEAQRKVDAVAPRPPQRRAQLAPLKRVSEGGTSPRQECMQGLSWRASQYQLLTKQAAVHRQAAAATMPPRMQSCAHPAPQLGTASQDPRLAIQAQPPHACWRRG